MEAQQEVSTSLIMPSENISLLALSSHPTGWVGLFCCVFHTVAVGNPQERPKSLSGPELEASKVKRQKKRIFTFFLFCSGVRERRQDFIRSSCSDRKLTQRTLTTDLLFRSKQNDLDLTERKYGPNTEKFKRYLHRLDLRSQKDVIATSVFWLLHTSTRCRHSLSSYSYIAARFL